MLRVEKDAFCEHCYELEPFDVVWCDDDNPDWCLNCAETFEEFDHTENEVEEAIRMSAIKQLKYYEGIIKELKKFLKEK